MITIFITELLAVSYVTKFCYLMYSVCVLSEENVVTLDSTDQPLISASEKIFRICSFI